MIKVKKVKTLVYVDDGENAFFQAFDVVWRADVPVKEILTLCKIAIDEIE